MRVRIFVFALLVLVSGYQCISQFLVSCCALAACQLHPWRFELEFFPSQLPCGQPYKFRFEANPIWYSTIKFTKSHSAKCHYTNGRDWGAASKSAHLNCTNLTNFRLTTGRFCRNSCIVMLWVACELLQFAAIQYDGMVRAFVDHTHTHSMNNLRWQSHWLPRLTSLLRKSHDWWRTWDSSLGQPTENEID